MDAAEPGRPEREAVERILEELHASCYGWAMVCCRWDREEAQEVLQSAYLKMLDGRANLNGSLNPRGFVLGVVRRTAAEQRRGRLARSLGLSRWLRGRPDPDPPASPERTSADDESRRLLRGMLERLSPRQRDVLHLVFYQEMTIEEASQVLGIALGSARAHYERGKARLRGLLTKEGIR